MIQILFSSTVNDIQTLRYGLELELMSCNAPPQGTIMRREQAVFLRAESLTFILYTCVRKRHFSNNNLQQGNYDKNMSYAKCIHIMSSSCQMFAVATSKDQRIT